MAQKKQNVTQIKPALKAIKGKRAGKGESSPGDSASVSSRGLTGKSAAAAKSSHSLLAPNGPEVGKSAPPPLPGGSDEDRVSEKKVAPNAGPKQAPPPLKSQGDSEDFDGNSERDGGARAPERRSARRRPAGPVRERLAANDDAPSIGGLIYALEQKPSIAPFKFAAIGSVVWAVFGIAYGWFALASDLGPDAGLAELLSKPAAFLTLTAVVVPIAVVWFLAVLAWRAEELRLRSSTMTEVAVRLAEPDRMAEQSVASLGQAVRRQVSFMNDAVSRALGRAGELEALVHNEVAALERSYEENERRIRGLISELSGERTALEETGGDFAKTLRTMGEEVPAVIEKLAGQQSKLANIIAGAGDNLTALETSLATSAGKLEMSLGSRTDQLQNVLEGYTGAIDQALGSRTEEMRVLLGDYTEGLAEALSSRTDKMEEVFSDHMKTLDASIGNRTDTLQNVFEEYARALDATLANRVDTMDSQLIERTRALDNAFNQRLQVFDESISKSTLAIDHAVGERALALTTALDSHAKTFKETIAEQAADLDESLVHGISAVRRSSENITRQSLKAIEGLANQSDMLKNVSENLLGQINTVTNRFDNQGQMILKAANSLENANFKIDSTLQERHAELSSTLDRMSGKADEFGQFVEGYSANIEGSLSDAELRARKAAEELRASAEFQQKAVLENFDRFHADADAKSSRALEDLRHRFSTVSDELTTQLGSISGRVEDTTKELREKAAQASAEIVAEQNRLKQQLASIPATTRAESETMRRALQDQLNALEQLAEISKTQAQKYDVAAPEASSPVGSTTTGPAQVRAVSGSQDGSQRGLSSLASSVARELDTRSGAGGQRAAQPASTGRQPGQQQAASARGRGDSAPRDRWSLGDLLQRASFDDDGGQGDMNPPGRAVQGGRPTAAASTVGARAPAQGSGFNIKVISNALDAASAGDIWERLRMGQRGVLDRRRYSPDGQLAFDDLVTRYRTDPQTQSTVSRYLADFEQALKDQDARDASGRLVQQQLVSDSGRAYLFLAHVSGRFG